MGGNFWLSVCLLLCNTPALAYIKFGGRMSPGNMLFNPLAFTPARSIQHPSLSPFFSHCLVDLVVKASASRAEDPWFECHLHEIFPGSSHTSDLKIGFPVTTLPGAWHYRINAGTGWRDVSILRLGEIESLVCNFYLSVAARKIVRICLWDTLACWWDVKQKTNKQTPLFSLSLSP